MGLTSAMYTGLTGLHVNQTRIEGIGNNIANVNTHGFRSTRTLFQTQFARLLSMGTPPNNDSGGTNPMQIGKGATVGTTQRTTMLGSLETTGMNTDLAIEGAGYFVVKDADGRQYYSRDGSFTLNAQNQLVTQDGNYVQGFGVDGNFAVVPGALQGLTIPIGQVNIARATETVELDGALSSADTIATSASAHASQALVAGGGGAAAANTALTDLRSAAAAGVPMFAAGDVITVSGVAKGERDLPAQQFVVGTDGNTLGDFANWLQTAFGIQTGNNLPGTPGVAVQNGQLVIQANPGEPNAIDIKSADITSSNATTALPFQFTQTADAEGTGVYTSFTLYDSLGSPVTVNATFALESLPNTGPVWRYYLESAENGNSGRALGTGTVTFNTEGKFVGVNGNQFSLDRTGSGAASPLTFTLDLSNLNGLSTKESNVLLGEQDGYPPGTLNNFSVERDGTITGVFSNGLTQTLGQVPVAMFRNEIGLVAEADNLFSVGPNSGPAQVTTAGLIGSGQIRGGALEMSNVDLTREFIGLITSSTGFQASSRVITVSNDMLDQLLLALR